MKTIKALMFAVVALCATFTFSSCSDDDDNSFRCNPAKVEVEEGTTAKALIRGGKEAYAIKVSDGNIATAKLSKDTIMVTGVKVGTTAIVVTDAQKQSLTLPVAVKAKTAALTLDKGSVSVAASKSDTVTAKTGTSPYTATVKDTKIATATVKGAKIAIKGIAAGTTTITVTDKNKKTATVQVTVTK